MNRTYFKFLFSTTIKKKPVWVIWLIYLLSCSMLILVAPAIAKANPLQLWANTTMPILQSFIGLVVAIFTAVLGVHIFKDGNEEGTELIVLSKPISRRSVMFTKFLVYGCLSLLVNLSCVIITLFTIFLPTFESKYYWGLIVSMFIGNGVTFAIFGSIAILLTVRLAKAGVIVTNTMISLILTIYQILSLVAFTTPLKSLTNHGVAPISYIISNRDDDGKYKEEHVVNLTFTRLQELLEDDPTAKVLEDYTWDAVEDYWKNEILTKTSVTGLNITDIGSQLALTYLSVGVNKYSDRQADRNFAISRFYNYTLTSPASQEVTNFEGEKQTLPFTYGLPSTYSYLGQSLYLPTEVYFFGIAPGGLSRLQGLKDKLPIGYVRETGKLLSNTDIYFEPEEWQKYKTTFDKMYKSVFNKDAEFTSGERSGQKVYPDSVTKLIHDKLTWCYSQQNLQNFFDFLWENLAKKYKEQLEINSVADLNERFMQFKYYAGYKAQQEQKDVIWNKSSLTPEEANKKQSVLDDDTFKTLAATLQATVVKKADDSTTWLAKHEGDLPLPILVGENTVTPFLNLMVSTANALNDDTALSEEIKSNCTLNTFLKTGSIFSVFTYPSEDYMYMSLDHDSRSAQVYGMINSTYFPYYTYFETVLTAKNHNMGLFFFKSKPTLNYWMFAIIWLVIAFGLFAAGIVIYNKYDVK